MNSKALTVVLAPVFGVAGFVLWPGQASTPAITPEAAIAAAEAAVAAPAEKPVSEIRPAIDKGQIEFAELHTAVEQGILKATFSGNGRDKLRATLINIGPSTLRVQATPGQLLESGKNAVAIVRSSMIEVAVGKTAEVDLQTVAVRSTNKVAEAAYTLSYNEATRVAPLITYAQQHLELSLPAIQTAALALAENLPLSAVAKFSPASGELKSRFNTDGFRVETTEILAALGALREMGVEDSSIAMTVDPQLKIEAMIEPLSRAAAMRYYGISEQNEWEFWKGELLDGAPETRHYALYGIARFYPEVALQMLPTWVRETKTNPVYRLSALQALADTQRVEALPLLRQLVDELGADTELGRAARGAADHLDQRLTQLSARQPAVAFRASKTPVQF